jgi:hypothetical protein
MISMLQDKGQWQDVVNVLINIYVTLNSFFFLKISATVNLSSKIVVSIIISNLLYSSSCMFEFNDSM